MTVLDNRPARPDNRYVAPAPAQPEAGRLTIPALGVSQIVLEVPVVAGQ